jgi:hypothetical protein
MSRPMAIRLALAGLLGLTATAALPVAGAAAAQPTRETLTQVLHSGAECPSGVVLQGLFDVTREVTTFYGSGGDPVSRLSINSAEGTWTNPLNGAVLTARVVREIHTDLTTGESFSTGTNSLTRLPGGGGVAIGGAGLSVFDSAGRLVEHFGPDTATERAQLCTALGA